MAQPPTPDTTTRITLRHTRDCPNWHAVDHALRSLVAGRDDVTVVRELIDTHEQATRAGFRGSPTVLIDGHDPWPQPPGPAGVGCRLYDTPRGLAGAPDAEQLAEAIRERCPPTRTADLPPAS